MRFIDALLFPFRDLACEIRVWFLRRKLGRKYPAEEGYGLKQKLILRKDLKMRRGKEISQAAHASQKLNIDHQFNPYVRLWMKGKFTKVAVGIETEEQMLDLYESAKSNEIPCSVIKDSGATEFQGIPTYTAIAVGPGDPDVVEKLTGDLKLR